MKALTICIPTYNRVEQLQELQANFLLLALEHYADSIDILVMDQSDEARAEANQRALDERVVYRRNTQRGYANNVSALLNEANSTYVWLISDDDHILWDGFQALMLEVTSNRADCILLPIKTCTLFDETFIENYPFLKRSSSTTLQELLIRDVSYLPFILLSDSVIRLNKQHISSIYSQRPDNVFVQVPMLFSMLELTSKVSVVTAPVIQYVNDYAMQWKVVAGLDDRVSAIKMVAEQLPSFKANVDSRIAAAIWGAITQSVERDTGLLYLPHSENIRHALRLRVLEHFKFQYWSMLTVLLLPKFMAVTLYKVIAVGLNVKMNCLSRNYLDRFNFFVQSYGALNRKIKSRQSQITYLKNNTASHVKTEAIKPV